MALRPCTKDAGKGLEAGGGRAGTGCRRCALGAVPAFENLGLIVVDEEHDPAFKQEDRVFYNARDMAVVRARIGTFPVILSSATPSIESRVNARQGRYRCVELPSRYADASLPTMKAVDMRRHAPARGGFLSPVLLTEMARRWRGASNRCCFSTGAAMHR